MLHGVRRTLAVALAGLTTCVFAEPCPDSSGEWQRLADGACHVRTTVTVDDKEYTVEGFRFDFNSYTVELVDAVGFFDARAGSKHRDEGRGSKPSGALSDRHDFTVAEIFDALGSKTAVVSSIGYPRFPGDVVLRGLLRVRGNTLTPIAAGDSEKRYLTGVICFDTRESQFTGAMVSAPMLYSYPDGESPHEACSSAIQVGPRVVEKRASPGVRSQWQ